MRTGGLADSRVCSTAARRRCTPRASGRSGLATLEVAGRRSGRRRSLPVVIADYEGERYLVAMLGAGAEGSRTCVRQTDARCCAGGGARRFVWRRSRALDRAPILRRYVEVATGARAAFPIDRRGTAQRVRGDRTALPGVPRAQPTIRRGGHVTLRRPPPCDAAAPQPTTAAVGANQYDGPPTQQRKRVSTGTRLRTSCSRCLSGRAEVVVRITPNRADRAFAPRSDGSRAAHGNAGRRVRHGAPSWRRERRGSRLAALAICRSS
jgi:hypothetical protein